MKRIFMFAIAAMTMLSSCSKDEKVIDSQEGKGEAAIRLTLSMPSTATRATHSTAAGESAIDDIHIYVFNTNGSAASKGAYTPLDFTTDFTANGTTGQYEINEAIPTTTGGKLVYVVTNLTKTGAITDPTTITSENDLLSAVIGVEDLLSYNGSNIDGIVMAGSDKVIMEPSVDDDTPLTVSLDRVVSRVVTTYSGSKITGGVVNLTWAGKAMKVKVVEYFISQDAHSTYLGQNYYTGGRKKTLIGDNIAQTDWANAINIYDPTSTTPEYVTIVQDNTTQGTRAGFAGFYIGENAVNVPGNIARHGNTTLAFIKTQLQALAATAKYTEGTGVTYDGAALGAGADFWIVRVDGVKDYICNAANYTAVFNFLKAEFPDNSVNAYFYPNGYIYYQVFLNSVQTGNDLHNVYRNQFIHLDITGLNMDSEADNGFGGGLPGDKDDPEKPAGNTDPNNPNPDKPIDPIDETDATLLITIAVTDWEYVPHSIELE